MTPEKMSDIRIVLTFFIVFILGVIGGMALGGLIK